MSTVESVQRISMPVAADYSAKQYYFMKVASGVATVAGDGEEAIGVLMDNPSAAADPGEIAIGGRVKVVASAAISVDAHLASTATGTAVTSTSGDYILGFALSAATAAGDVIEMLFHPNGKTA